MKIGKNYTINSSRKGIFKGELLSECDTWATFKITNGKANAMLDYNVKSEGESVTVRKSFCSFKEMD